MKWERKMGGRMHQQQLQASNKFKGEPKRFAGMWVLETDTAWNGDGRIKKLTCERIFSEAVMPCSQSQHEFSKEGHLCFNFEKSSM